ncbi:MAG: topoisomerase IV [Clostridia bacterium]|nr:topoisomerase IV [Clostridia bacterium]
MARKKKAVEIIDAPEAEVTYQPITETIEKNYMPYVMSVIVSRAIPDIDGFKPSHRKLLYTMYKMGLLTGPRQKSSNVVGQTMQYHPHGDMAIYETLVRLTKANEALLHPFVDSKGSFGKQYSRDMAFAASRYTEVKLDKICNELFTGIDKNAVDMVPNYDNSKVEPTLLPTAFPNILVSPNLGIAVGMACSICSFNLVEVCNGTIALLRNPNTSLERMMNLVKAPDFPGGAHLLYDKAKLTEIYKTGVGSVRLRAKYRYDEENNSIDIIEIPYSTSIEAISKKVTDLIKEGKIKDIVDVRDAIDLSASRLLVFELKRGMNKEKADLLMKKLYKLTPLEDAFDCNFNILIDGSPRQMGIVEILSEWIRFRMKCLTRETEFDLEKKQDKLELLTGLAAILLDVDKAIRIIRSTEKDSDVVPNLQSAFNLSQRQAEYVAEIKLRHLNREYIYNRVSEIEDLRKEIEALEELLRDDVKMKDKIISQLEVIKKTYGKPRKTEIVEEYETIDLKNDEMFVENYNVKLIMTSEGYFKKITQQSLRGNDEQKLKEGDFVVYDEDTDNTGELIIFTDKAQAYKAKVSDFDLCKASALGDYLPAKLNMEENEHPIMCKMIREYNENHNIIVAFENGKAVRISMKNYETKGNRKRLTAAFSTACPPVGAIYEAEPMNIMLFNNGRKVITINSSLIPIKSTRTSIGTTAFSLTSRQKLTDICAVREDTEELASKYKKRKIPAVGVVLEEESSIVFKTLNKRG